MIIGFSGIGGSGKSTIVRLLQDTYTPNVAVIALREYLLWPKLISLITSKKSIHRAKQKSDSKNSFLRRLYLSSRDLFYVFDLWRIWIFLKIAYGKNTLVFLDRTPIDFVIELSFSHSNSKKHLAMLSRFVPRLKNNMYFFVPSGLSQARKDEGTATEDLEKMLELYEYFVVDGALIQLPAFKTIDEVLSLSKNLIDTIRYSNGCCMDIIFYDRLTEGILSDIYVSPSILLRKAANNRIVWKFLLSDGEFTALRKRGEERIQLFTKTVEKLPYIFSGINFSLQKNDFQFVEIPGDVDILFSDEHDFAKALAVVPTQATIKMNEQSKADICIPDLLPLDIHVGARFGHLSYLSEFALSSPAALVLLISAHAVAEMGLVTLGDVVKVKEYLHEDTLKEAERIATSHGWGKSYRAWIHVVMNPHLYHYAFPVSLSAWALFQSRISMIYKARGAYLLQEGTMLLRILRARATGKIPFHDSWIDE